MGYKKIWQGSGTNQTFTNDIIRDRLNRIVTEFTLAGVPRTADTGQLNIATLDVATFTPRPYFGVVGFIMFKVFDNCLLRFDVRLNLTSSGTGNMVLVPIFGATTDGAGNFTSSTTGNSGGYNSGGDQSSDSLTVRSDINSYIYKSDNTFWFALDIDKSKSAAVIAGQQWRPTSVAFVTKTVDDSFSVIDDAFHCYIPTGVAQSSAPSNIWVKSFTPPDENGISLKNTPPTDIFYTHSFISPTNFNSTDPVYFVQPVLGTIRGITGFNYDLLLVRSNALGNTPYQEITLNVNGVNRNYLYFYNSASTGAAPSGYMIFNLLSIAQAGSVLIWD